MTLVDRLDAVGLRMPDYGGRELGAILPAALSSIGAARVVTSRDAVADQVRLGFPEARHVCVVVVDGLGAHQLEARKGHAPFLRSIAHGTATAGFPTTTASSLTMFGTGFAPGSTGMTGYSVRNPRTGKLANLVSWEGAYDPLEWQQKPSLFEEAHNGGVNVIRLGKARFAGSGLTQASLRGGLFVGAEKLADRIDVALGNAREPGISYMYWGEIDAAGHRFGWQSEEWVAALEDADRELERLARNLPPSTLLVITADHGMVDVKGEARWDVADTPHLSDGVELIAGEQRAVHVHTAAGQADVVAARWADVLGAHAVVVTREEAKVVELFGPMLPEVEERIGDVVAVMAGRATVVDSRTQSEQSLGLIGVHGSLTPEELDIPVLVAVN